MKRTIILFFLFLMIAGAALAEEWICPSCGEANTSKFCEECGTKKPDGKWTCPTCGSINEKKFCTECGTKKPEATDKEMLGTTDKLKPDTTERPDTTDKTKPVITNLYWDESEHRVALRWEVSSVEVTDWLIYIHYGDTKMTNDVVTEGKGIIPEQIVNGKRFYKHAIPNPRFIPGSKIGVSLVGTKLVDNVYKYVTDESEIAQMTIPINKGTSSLVIKDYHCKPLSEASLFRMTKTIIEMYNHEHSWEDYMEIRHSVIDFSYEVGNYSGEQLSYMIISPSKDVCYVGSDVPQKNGFSDISTGIGYCFENIYRLHSIGIEKGIYHLETGTYLFELYDWTHMDYIGEIEFTVTQ